jgi:hypothetical protein
MIRSISTTALLLLISFSAFSQTKNVLFLGNSYIAVNNLPQMTTDLALSAGDTLITKNNTPGGYRMQYHAQDQTSLALIRSQKWDHVVLQAQSQETSFRISQVQSNVFPYAKALCDSIRANDSCTTPMFYMTWGRENGDQSNCPGWPIVCTYEGMDSMINLRYRMMGDSNDAAVSPVGAVWHYIRANHKGIQLYSADESHPSKAGTYAAACTFYSVIFRKDPTNITDDLNLSAVDAENIRDAVKKVVFDTLSQWNVGPLSKFSYTISDKTVEFTNHSFKADFYSWDFGDGNISSDTSPTHTYPSLGVRNVKLVATKCGVSDTTTVTIDVGNTLGLDDSDIAQISIYPNPSNGNYSIKGISAPYEVEVMDLNGKTVYNASLEENRLNISHLEKGLYIVKILSANSESIYTQKLIRK